MENNGSLKEIGAVGVQIMRHLCIPERSNLARVCRETRTWWRPSFDADTYGGGIPHRLDERGVNDSDKWLDLTRECYEQKIRLHRRPNIPLRWWASRFRGGTEVMACSREQQILAEQTLMHLACYGPTTPWKPEAYEAYEAALKIQGRDDEAAVFTERHALTLALHTTIASENYSQTDQLLQQGAQFDLDELYLHANHRSKGIYARDPSGSCWLASRLARQCDGQARLAAVIEKGYYWDVFNDQDNYRRDYNQGQAPELESMAAMLAHLVTLDPLHALIQHIAAHASNESPKVKGLMHAIAQHHRLTIPQGDSILRYLARCASQESALAGPDYSCAAGLLRSGRCTKSGSIAYLDAIKHKLLGLFADWPEGGRIAIELPSGERLAARLGGKPADFPWSNAGRHPGSH